MASASRGDPAQLAKSVADSLARLRHFRSTLRRGQLSAVEKHAALMRVSRGTALRASRPALTRAGADGTQTVDGCALLMSKIVRTYKMADHFEVNNLTLWCEC